MITSPHVYAALATQHQADIRAEAGARRLARRLLAERRVSRRTARDALRAARLEAALGQRTIVTGSPTSAIGNIRSAVAQTR